MTRHKFLFEAQEKHIIARLGVQAHKQEGIRFLCGVAIQFQDRLLIIDTTQFLAQGVDFLVISKSPDTHAANVFSHYRTDEIEALTRNYPRDVHVTASSGQCHQPAPVGLPAAPLLQNIASVGHVVHHDANLRWLHLSLSTTLHNEPLVVQQLSQRSLVKILKIKWLLLVIAHLLQVLSQRSIAGVEANTWAEDPYSGKLVLVIPQQQVQDYLRFT